LPLPVLEEVVAATPLNRAASFAFALSRCAVARPVMIVLPIAEARESGRPGVFGMGSQRPGSPLLLVSPRSVADALWTMEQALKSGALGGVLGIIEGATLTQSRRLDFAARDGGTFACLLRVRGDGLSAARRRWRIAALPSLANPLDPAAPGMARLHAELLRQRDGPPGDWVLEQTPGGFAVAAGLAAERPRADQRRAA
jgi:protein ImuA